MQINKKTWKQLKQSYANRRYRIKLKIMLKSSEPLILRSSLDLLFPELHYTNRGITINWIKGGAKS